MHGADVALRPVEDRDPDVRVSLREQFGQRAYPMMADDTCWFLAADFDKETWRRDTGAYLAACRVKIALDLVHGIF